MSQFDAKTFNGQVFGRYVNRIPNLKRNELLKAGVLEVRNDLKSMLADQTGGNYITIPLKGLLDGAALNYDGNTDITATSTKTYTQSMIVIGRAKAWTEKDFSFDITGEDFMDNVAAQISEYWEAVDQDTMLAILKGIFAMTGTGNIDFVNNHTSDITEADTSVDAGANKAGISTLNNAIQKASGDNKSTFTLSFMHSAVATNLENLNQLAFLKYTDKDGITRDLAIATWNGRVVIIDDSMPHQTGYYASTQGTTGAVKVVASGAGAGEVNLADVKKTDFYPSAVAANDYVIAGDKYITYVLGRNAFTYCDCGAKVPYEMYRDPKTAGGADTLYTRQRKLFAPKGISFTKASMTSLSPTDAELATGSNWELVNDGAASNKTYINHKAIAIARIISRG